MKRRIAVRGVIEKNGKLLCVRNRLDKGGQTANAFWCMPGGKLEPGESLVDGLKRELLEELGVAADIGQLVSIQQFVDPTKTEESLEFFFSVNNADDFENIDLSQTSHGQAELADYDFVDPKTANILPDFLRNYPDLPMINSYL